MSEETPKVTTRRRPITASAPTKKAEVQKPADSPDYEIPVDQAAPEAAPKEETKTAQEPVVQTVDQNAISDKEYSEEEWAAEIERQKAAKEAGAPAVRHADGNNAAVAEAAKQAAIESETSAMDAEVERRVQQRLAEEEAKRVKEDPLATKDEKTAAAKEAADKSEQDRQQRVSTENDASTFVHLSLGNDDDFMNGFEREISEDDRPESERTNDPTPYAAGLALTRQLGQRNNEHRLLLKWIGQILDRNAKAFEAVSKEMRLARVTPKIGDGSGPKKLSGQTAKAAVISRMKGMYRVQLYNSGFWLDLRPPTLIDIDGWMQEVDTNFKELGRTLGGHAHSVIDIYLKQKFFEILPSMIQRSNFESYNDPNKLVSNISFHDYDTLLWAFCCMMYKDGVGVGIYCTNPDCRHIDDHQYVDLRNICFLNTEIFNPKAVEWMTRGAHVGGKLLTEDDLKQYREEILGFKKTLTFDEGKTVYELQVPTVRQFIEEGTALITKMENLLNGKHDITTDVVSNQLTYHLYKMLNPWIKALIMNDDEGKLVYRIEDRDAIYESLDVNQFENSDIYQQVTDFIRDTKISFYSSTTLKCPKCGKVANLEHDNMFPLDMQYLFFCLSCLQLEQTGASF